MVDISRVAISDTAWGAIQKHPEIITINGKTPNDSGEIALDIGSGPQGDTGPQGPEGLQGNPGPQGNPGVKGEQGEKGDMGDGFTITATYKTIVEMNADYGNSLIPIGAFVIISSDTPDTDPDNSKVFVKGDVEYRFQSVLRGLKGETGDRGLQGVAGPQGTTGSRGVQGVPGAIGPKGNDIKLKGTVASESEIANMNRNPLNQPGDAYWTEDTGRLYVFSTDIGVNVSEPSFVRGPILRGAQGIPGQQGIRGPVGPAAVVVDGSTTVKGIVQVGDGLSVSNGLVSINRENLTIFKPTVNAAFTTYPNGFSGERSLVNDNALHNQLITYLNSLMGINLPVGSTVVKFFISTFRDGTAGVQVVDVHVNNVNSIKMFEMIRTAFNDVWENWTINPTEVYSRVNPAGNVTAIYGTLCRNITNGNLYIKRGSLIASESTNWELVNVGTTSAAVVKTTAFTGTFSSNVTKQGIFTRLDLSFINPSGVSVNAGTEVVVGVVPDGFRPTVRAHKFYVGDNTGTRTPRHAIIVYTNGNIGWTPSVTAGYWTMDGSTVY